MVASSTVLHTILGMKNYQLDSLNIMYCGRNAVYKESFWQFPKEQGYIEPRTVNRYTHIFPQYLLDSNDLAKDVEVGSDFQFVQSFDDKL